MNLLSAFMFEQWLEEHQFLECLIQIICGTYVPEEIPAAVAQPEPPEKAERETSEKPDANHKEEAKDAGGSDADGDKGKVLPRYCLFINFVICYSTYASSPSFLVQVHQSQRTARRPVQQWRTRRRGTRRRRRSFASRPSPPPTPRRCCATSS